MHFRFISVVLLSILFLSASAQAQEYSDVSWSNLIRTMVRFRAIDLTELSLLDEYAIVSECDLYKAFYSDDFKWNKVREAIRESIKVNIATYPTNYHFDSTMRLDRYDFETKIFRFTEKSSLHGINKLGIFSIDGTNCEDTRVNYLPRDFHVVLSTPISLEGLPLSERDAKALLSRMDKQRNPKRVIFTRFNFRTVYIEPLRKTKDKGRARGITYEQSRSDSPRETRFDAQLDSIGFYEDSERSRLIYLYTP